MLNSKDLKEVSQFIKKCTRNQSLLFDNISFLEKARIEANKQKAANAQETNSQTTSPQAVSTHAAKTQAAPVSILR